MLDDECLELADDRSRLSGLDLRVDALLEQCQPQCLEPRDFALREGLVAELLERRPAPELKCVAKLRAALARGHDLRLLQERLRAVHVQLGGVDANQVSGRLRDDPVRSEHLAQLRDEVLERRPRRSRRLLAPERFDQPVGGDRPPRVEQEQREEGALLRASKLERRIFAGHLERAEQAVVLTVSYADHLAFCRRIAPGCQCVNRPTGRR